MWKLLEGDHKKANQITESIAVPGGMVIRTIWQGCGVGGSIALVFVPLADYATYEAWSRGVVSK